MVIKPDDLLKSSLGKPVLVVLKNGEEIKGTLKSYDEFINLTLTDAANTKGKSKLFIIKGSKILFLSQQ